MSRLKPLNEEEIRILRAASEGRLLENANGRYVIVGEARPDRRRRESLHKRGLIVFTFGPRGWVLTDAGAERLAVACGPVANESRNQAENKGAKGRGPGA